MSTGVEAIQVVNPWLFGRLNGDAALRALVTEVSNTLAPGALKPPYVTFSLASNRDRVTRQGVRLWSSCIYHVKGVTQSASWSEVEPIAARIDLLLNGPDGRGVYVDTPRGRIECHRESVIAYPEMIQGIQYRHLGGQYRVLVHAA